ncbi:hypothetical protein [Paraburkholderia dipogonis]
MAVVPRKQPLTRADTAAKLWAGYVYRIRLCPTNKLPFETVGWIVDNGSA